MNIFLKTLLFPLSILYGIITYVRNKLFDLNIFRYTSFKIPIINVGNINTGGTGKSPCIELLINILNNNNFNIATLSRGYGRQTKGFIVAEKHSNSQSLGDEPIQFYHRFPGITVSVSENRVKGIKRLLQLKPPPDIILLDDAFQHRQVKPGFNILLTDYSELYIHDCMLPAGRLREYKSGAARANIIITTKSPAEISELEKNKIIKSINPRPHQQVFFSFIHYGELISFFKNTSNKYSDTNKSNVLLFSGIANPKPLESFLRSKYHQVISMNFKDHHTYTARDITRIKQKFYTFTPGNNIIVTTGKDYARLLNRPEINMLNDLPLYYLPIEMGFSLQDYSHFEQLILNYARKNQSNP